jgi:nucleoside-diphosphate-sugar epimerase
MDDQPSAVVAINVTGTLNILEAARLCRVNRVVFVSSGAVYGFSSSDRICEEFSTLDPDNIYGATKAAGEMLIRGYGARFGLNFIILRLVSLYGPRRQTFYMPGYLLACAMDGIPTYIRGGDQAVDFIHVSDAGRAVVKALESTIGAGRVYNVATGVKHTYNEIADIVRTLVPGCRIEIEAGTGGFPSESQINIERAARDLGFRPAIDLQRGIEALYREFTSRPDLRAAARAAAKLVGPLVSSQSSQEAGAKILEGREHEQAGEGSASTDEHRTGATHSNGCR